MSGPELCPKCKGLHYRNSPCIVRVTKSTATKVGTASNQRSSHGSSVVERGDAGRDSRRPRDAGSIPALPVDTNNPSSPKGSGVESLRTPTEGRKGRDSTSGGARDELRDPSAVLTQTAAQPPVGTPTKRPRGRPRIHPDRKAYKAQWEREKRKRLKDAKAKQG